MQGTACGKDNAVVPAHLACCMDASCSQHTYGSSLRLAVHMLSAVSAAACRLPASHARLHAVSGSALRHAGRPCAHCRLQQRGAGSVLHVPGVQRSQQRIRPGQAADTGEMIHADACCSCAVQACPLNCLYTQLPANAELPLCTLEAADPKLHDSRPHPILTLCQRLHCCCCVQLWTADWFNGKRDRSHCMYALYDYFYTATGKKESARQYKKQQAGARACRKPTSFAKFKVQQRPAHCSAGVKC